MVQISKSTLADLPVLMDLYEQGKRIMRRNGNMHQWTKGYPTEEVVKQDIVRGNSYLCLDEDGRPVGTFAFIVPPETRLPLLRHHLPAERGRAAGVPENKPWQTGRRIKAYHIDYPYSSRSSSTLMPVK